METQGNKMKYYGYAGKELYINLDTGEIDEKPLDLASAVKFLGGMGIQQRMLYDLLKPGTDPFAPEAPIVFGSGPLTGTGAPGSPRIMATLKYPETNATGSAGGAMRFGFMLKFAGYDHVVITGKSAEPVYVMISDNTAKICDAKHLWGMDIVQTTEALWDRHGDCGVIAMGQAGEHLGIMAQATCDLGSTIGRGGLAGVMGSKNLKALVASGTGSIRIADPERFNKIREKMFERARSYKYHGNIRRYGIMENWRNYSIQFAYQKNRTFIEDLRKYDKEVGFEAYKKLEKKAFGCPSCFIVDKEILKIGSGKHKGKKWHTPSYLNGAMLAIKLGLKNAEEALIVGDATDRYGIDQIGSSDLMDFLYTLHEEGVLTEADAGGIPLTRGNIEGVLELLDKMAYRKGFGNEMADGWAGMKRVFGDEFVNKKTSLIKGRMGVWEPRISGLGTNEFAQLVYPRGPNAECGGSGLYTLGQPLETVASHARRMGMSEEAIQRSLDSNLKINIGRFVTSSEHWLALFNSLGICNRHVNNRFYSIDTISELYSAATGIEHTTDDLMTSAERIWNAFKMVNVREGFSRKDDEPPENWFEPMVAFNGKSRYMMDYFQTRRITKDDVDQWLTDYYMERGWDPATGIPTKEKLACLEIDDLEVDNRAQI
jgi:aldehyde:ferredoxin oxidoreductase